MPPKKSSKSPETLLQVENAVLSRGNVDALRGLSWTLRRGEHWAVLGPNGSGKSTLVQMLQGRLWPREGDLSVLGRRFGEDDVDELRRHVAWVGSEVEPEFPGRQAVGDVAASGAVGTLGIQFDAPKVAQRREAARALSLMGMTRLAERPFSQLSQGQRRRAVIARALAMRPDLLLLDEPTSGLDPVAREGFLASLAKLLRPDSRPAVVYVTHYVEEILPAFTHVLLLRAGRAVAAGPKREVLTSALLEKTFGAKLKVERRGGRTWLRAG
ncbi:MAG TPA: ATP-binding cassette domain-containing protein [Fibrobacteria bacterium]|jgi:iron complex transport system ATP-binding protein|nr:ATP-binding cassette domain-containing protein [Fibrobacteria bacterium]